MITEIFFLIIIFPISKNIEITVTIKIKTAYRNDLKSTAPVVKNAPIKVIIESEKLMIVTVYLKNDAALL